MLITLFFVMTLSFFVVRLMPMNIFENPEVPLEVQEKLEDKFHLNDPLPVQYFYFMEGIVTGLDFGISIKLRPGLDVFPIMIERLPPTMLINFISLFISIPLGLIFGIIAALKRNTWVDHLISLLVILFISIPSFVFASLLQYLLTFKWQLFPTLYDPQAKTFGDMMWSLCLPIVALSLNPIATLTRYLRGELIENISSEYILLARTKMILMMLILIIMALKSQEKVEMKALFTFLTRSARLYLLILMKENPLFLAKDTKKHYSYQFKENVLMYVLWKSLLENMQKPLQL